MHPFEFVTVLISIIIGLGIAVLLEGLARILRGELDVYWVHLLWALSAFMLIVQEFWELFEGATRTDWTLLDLSALLLAPMLVFLFAATLFPAASADPDLRRHYYARRRPLFITLSLLFVYFNLQAPGFSLADFAQFAPLVIAITLVLSERPRVHEVLSVLFAVGATVSIGLFSFDLGTSQF